MAYKRASGSRLCYSTEAGEIGNRIEVDAINVHSTSWIDIRVVNKLGGTLMSVPFITVDQVKELLVDLESALTVAERCKPEPEPEPLKIEVGQRVKYVVRGGAEYINTYVGRGRGLRDEGADLDGEVYYGTVLETQTPDLKVDFGRNHWGEPLRQWVNREAVTPVAHNFYS